MAVIRSALFLCGFAAGASAVWLGATHALAVAEISRVSLALDLTTVTRKVTRSLEKDRGPQRIALLGDSNMMAAEGMSSRRQTLPARVHQALRRYGERGQRTTLHTLCVPGLGPSAIYFVTDSVIATRPDRVVIALNLRAFNRVAMNSYGYAEAAGLMSASQLAAALRLPILPFGLTADRMLFYGTVDAFGGTSAFARARQLQARAFRLREQAAEWLDTSVGSRGHADLQFALGMARLARARVPGRDRLTREMAERNFAPLLRGLSARHPGLRMLTAALARYRKADIPTLVYAEPVNVEHLRTLGLDLEPLRTSISTIDAAVRREGARFTDFHDLFPDAAFRDGGDHYTFEGAPNGTTWLGDRIAYAIMSSEPAAFVGTAGDAVQ